MNTDSFRKPHRCRKQSGVMLLEALVGILIFSVGILAMIGLQAASISNNANATYRSEASYLANQIIGQMWADKNNVGSYALNQTTATNCLANPSSCCPAGANLPLSTAPASVTANINNWLTQVYRLPQASTVQQSIAIGAKNVVTVALCWQAPNETVKHNFVASTQIN